MLRLILGLAFGLICLLAVLAYFQPSTYEVTRSVTIERPRAQIFSFVEDFRRWEVWSPWAKLDPMMKLTFSGPEKGEGAVYAWDGNKDVGAGRMTLLKAIPGERVVIKLEFFRPFASEATMEFLLTEAPATQISWKMSGENSVPGRVMGIFVSMVKMIGKDFEKGLQQLKAAAESSPR